MQIPESRFNVLALAPFHTDAARIWEGPPLAVDRVDIDSTMAALDISMPISLESNLCPDRRLTFKIDKLKDLHPDGIIATHSFFAKLYQAIEFVKNARRSGADEATIRQGLHQWPDLPPITIAKTPIAPPKPSSDAKVDKILSMVAFDDSSPASASSILSEVSQYEAVAEEILGILFSDPDFQRLESAWRGLRLLLQQSVSDNGNAPCVSIAAVHPQTLSESLGALTTHLLEDLPDLILLDLAFDNSPLSMERLITVAQWAATLMVPTIVWAGPHFFQLSDWREIDTLPFIPNHLESSAYAKFRKLQQSLDGQWICMTCNRFLLRFPYGDDNRPRKIDFKETQLPWVAPVWALGALIAQRAAHTGWPTRFNDIHQSRIQDLAFHTPPGLPPVVSETLFNSDRLVQFTRAGITPLATQSKKDSAFFPKAVTLSAGSLGYQLLLAQVTQFILWCKDTMPPEEHPDVLSASLEKALSAFSNRSRPSGFSEIRVVAGPVEADGGIPVHFTLTPDVSVLGTQQPIELQLTW